MKKRILSMILTLAMALSLLPASALAAAPQEITLNADEERALEIDGHSITFIARAPGATLIQATDNNVADGTFIVMTSGTVDAALAPGQTLTVAYSDGDGGYTNACTIQAAAGNNSDIALLLRGDSGYNNAVILDHGEAMTMAGILYEFTNDVDSRALTIDFHMDLDSPTSDIHFASGSLKISAPDDYTDIFNGYDFAEGCTEAEFTFSADGDGHSVISLTDGAIGLDEGESVTVNGVLVESDGNTLVRMGKDTGIVTLEGSAIIGGKLELRGNAGDDDFPSAADIAANGFVTLRDGELTVLETTTVALSNGGTLTMEADTELTYSSDGNYLELREGAITASGVEDTVYASHRALLGESYGEVNIELFPAGDADYTVESGWDSVTLSNLSGDVNVIMDEGSELHYDTGDGTKTIKAQSYTGLMTIQDDGSILEDETAITPNEDGDYMAGAAHQSVILGGFTVYGNPNGVGYNEEDGILILEVKGHYEIANTNADATTDKIEIAASGSSITLKGVRIKAAEGNALTITSDSVTISVDGDNSLSGGAEASGLVHYNMDPLSICGSGTLTVTGNEYPAIDGSISVESAEIIATGAEGIYGNVTVGGGSVTATGTTHAGISGNVRVDSGSVTAVGGSGGNGSDGEPAIDGGVSVYSGSVTATGGSAVSGSNGNGGAGTTGSVYVYSGTAALTGGSGSGTGHGGMGMGGDNGLHTSWIGVGGSIRSSGGSNGSSGTAQASALTIAANNAMLDPSGENTSFTLTAEENSVRLSNIGGNALIFMYHDDSYENGGSLIVEDSSRTEHTITIDATEGSSNLTIDSTGSITGETEAVTITSKAPPTAANVTYAPNLKLSASVLTGGKVTNADGTPVAGTWAWADPNTLLYAGTASYTAEFTPAESGIDSVQTSVEVTVSPAEQVLTSQYPDADHRCTHHAGAPMELKNMVTSDRNVSPVFVITKDEGEAYVEGTVLHSPDAGFVTLEARFPGVDVNGDGTYEYTPDSVEIHTLFTTVPMYRMYDPTEHGGEHFYTGSEVERDHLVSVGWKFEGVGFNFPVVGAPVYRLYDKNGSGDHLYTMDQAEIDRLVAQGWTVEGVAFNSAANTNTEVAQYRLYNPNAHLNGTRGAWHFTSDAGERAMLESAGWEYQGIGWYSTRK